MGPFEWYVTLKRSLFGKLPTYKALDILLEKNRVHWTTYLLSALRITWMAPIGPIYNIPRDKSLRKSCRSHQERKGKLRNENEIKLKIKAEKWSWRRRKEIISWTWNIIHKSVQKDQKLRKMTIKSKRNWEKNEKTRKKG